MVLTTLNIRLKSFAILDTSQINLKLGIFTDFNDQQCRQIFANWSTQKDREGVHCTKFTLASHQ